MGRVHLLELEDQPWFPARLREWTVDHLSFVQDLVDAYRPVVPVIEELVRTQAEGRVVDLCSGSGAAPAALKRGLTARGVACDVVLTDLYPNVDAFEARERDGVRHIDEPVDATAVPDELTGVRTLFNAFHHLPPAAAKALLEDAANKGQPIVVVETVGRSLRAVLLVAAITLGAFGLAPFVRPFSVGRLFFTYVIPAIPFVVLFDGIVSCLRVYAPDELRALTVDVNSDAYTFEVRRLPVPYAPVEHVLFIGRPTTAA